MNKPVLIVIAGPNGSGKTTITQRVVKHEWAERVNISTRIGHYLNMIKQLNHKFA